MPWYRRPEEEEPAESGCGARGGRGRGRARGRARGRGRGRPPHEPAQHPYVMGPPGSYAAPPFYHHSSGMEDMLPHWQYVLRTQQESHRMPNPTMLGPQRFPTRRDSHAGPTPYFNYEAAMNRDQYTSGGFTNLLTPLTAQQAHTIQGGFVQSPGFHHPVFSHAPYGRYANHNPNQQKGQQQGVDKQTAKKVDSSKEKRSSSVRKEASQKPSITNNLVISQAPNVQQNPAPLHHMTGLVATIVSRPEAPKTLDETAAFLNDPQTAFQKNKILKSSEIARPIHATSNALLQTAIIARDSTQTAQLLPSRTQLQTLSAKDPINVRHDGASSSEIPDFRKYSELSVTIAEVEPPPAHQASVAKSGMCLKYPDLHTPPIAHQAPSSHNPAQPQSARLHAMTSPPPAHQNSTTHSIHHNMHPSHIESFNPQARQLSIVKATADNIVTATHASYDDHQILRKAQLIYEPSTDTIAAENVLYRPEKDLFSKEQVVYQRNNIMFAKTEIIYKDVIARAETVYESDKVTARETVIQRPPGAMEGITQHNVTSALQSMQRTAALYRRQAEIIEQTRTEALVASEHRSRSDAFAQMTATEQTYNKAFVESKQPSQSDGFAQMIAEQKIRRQALIEAEHRSRRDAYAQMIAAEQTYTKALVEAEHRSRSNAFAQMIATEQMYTNPLVEAEYRSRNEAYAQIIATEQACAKALVEAEQRSRSDAFAQMMAEQRPRTKAVVKAEHLSRSDAFTQMIAAGQTRTQALVEAEHRAHFQSALEAQTRHRHNSLRETKLHEESLENSTIFHDRLPNEHEQLESSETSRNMYILRLLLHCNALNNSSDDKNSEIPSQSLRQTRKRKTSSTRASHAEAPPPQPSTSSGPPTTAADLQALIALNWSLQNLPAGLQVTPNYAREVTKNGNTTDASDGDDD